MTSHATQQQLEAGLEHIRQAPADAGELKMIVRRPGTDRREVLKAGELCTEQGLVGDNWSERGSPRTADGGPHPDMQLNIMNARAAALVAGSEDRWPLARAGAEPRSIEVRREMLGFAPEYFVITNFRTFNSMDDDLRAYLDGEGEVVARTPDYLIYRLADDAR